MAQNLQLDPKKRDYVLSQSGSSIGSDRVEEAVYYALTIPQGRWLYGSPTQGSKLYTLDNVKRTGSVEQQISSFVTEALDRQIIAPVLATSQQFQNLEATRTGSSNNIAVTSEEAKTSDQFSFVAV